MTSPDPASDTPDEELSAEARAVIARARRSFGFSIGILLIGFIAIVLALVYRATRDDDGAAAHRAPEAIVLPAGAAVISAVPAGGTIAVTYTLDGDTRLRLVDAATGAPLGADTVFVFEGE